MSEILQLLNQPCNYLYALFVCLSIGMWLITVIGFVSMSALDGLFDFAFDIDTETSTDLELDADTNIELDNSIGHLSSFVVFLNFLGIGKVPVTLIVTLLMFIQGCLGISFNYYLYKLQFLPDQYNWLGVLVGIACTFVVALYATAYLVRPLYPLFRDYGQAEKSSSLVGQTASITSGKANQRFGQARIRLASGDSVEITVRTIDDDEVEYGRRVVVVDLDTDKNIYYVQPYETTN